MQEHPHDSQRPQPEQADWNIAPATTPPSRRRRTNRTILIVAGSTLGFFVVVGGIGAALGKGKTSSTPTAASTPSAPAASAAPSTASRPTETQPASSKPAAHPSSAAPSTAAADPEPSCALPNGRDVLVRYIVPGLQANAQELGEVDLVQCESTLDYIAQTSPTGDGYCTQVAWASDNPGYNPDTVPAPPLKKVIEAVGGGC